MIDGNAFVGWVFDNWPMLFWLFIIVFIILVGERIVRVLTGKSRAEREARRMKDKHSASSNSPSPREDSR